jgi:hypothetical protein
MRPHSDSTVLSVVSVVVFERQQTHQNSSMSFASNPNKVKAEVTPVTQRIALKSAFDQVGFHKKLHIARFVGFGDSEQFAPSKLPAPVEMRRIEPPAVVERPMNPRKARAKYQVTEVAKSAPLLPSATDDEAKRHQKLSLTCAQQQQADSKSSSSKRQAFDGQLEAGQKSCYVVFVSRGAGEFSVMPVSDWYNFKKRVVSAQEKSSVSLDAIERHIKQQRRTDRFLMPKSSLIGRDGAQDIEDRDEPMDPLQYASRHAPRFEDEEIRADPDADFNAAASDDEGDAAQLARPDEEKQAASELKVYGVLPDDAAETDSKLTDTGKRIRKLLDRDENEEESTSDDAEEEEDDDDEENEDDEKENDDDDVDDAVTKKGGKLSGQKRKGAPEPSETFDLAHGKRVRQSGVPVQPPNAVNDAEMLRVVRESGALQLSELLARFRTLLKDHEQNKSLFKQALRRLTDDGQLVFSTDADNVSYCHVTRR